MDKCYKTYSYDVILIIHGSKSVKTMASEVNVARWELSHRFQVAMQVTLVQKKAWCHNA